ncbi:MAG: 3-isopropylmalate dehydrogenase [Chloroflexi bacterium]|nr:3-isopropylmalate dehydrogenase [Chloroflexota bacterium]
MEFDITVLPGDGIGPEVVAEGLKVLNAISDRFHHTFRFHHALLGGIAIDTHGTAMPAETLDTAKKSDAVLLGAVGGPKWDDPTKPVRPEQGLLGIRKGLNLFANLRPIKLMSSLLHASTIKPETLDGTDLIIVRELTGGLYFGKPSRQWTNAQGRRAVDTLAYSEKEIRRILLTGFELARGRKKRLTSVDKANVLTTSRLWRAIANELAVDYPDVKLEHMLVDACAMHLIRRPAAFDVIVTENMFGDILTDEASMLAGSMGMLPSASLGTRTWRRNGQTLRLGLYEPIPGSAPDIAGQGKANPIATIQSVALMLRLSFGLDAEAEAVEKAVIDVLALGYRTVDIMEESATLTTTTEMGNIISDRIHHG